MAQLNEQLFQAIETIIEQNLNDLHFDITEKCTVIGVENEIQNTYRVKNNNLRYVAKALEGATYESDDVVSVTVPKGKYDNEPIINGKYTKAAEKRRTYKEPLSQILDYGRKKLMTSGSSPQPVILHVGPTDSKNNLKHKINLDSDFLMGFSKASSLGTFDFIGIQFNLQTNWGNLPKTQAPTGKFWLTVKLLKGNKVLGSVYEGVSTLLFSHEDVDGDIYNLQFDNNIQSKVWHFPEDVDPRDITAIQVEIGSAECNYVEWHGVTGLPDIVEEESEEPYTLKDVGVRFSDIEIILGYDLETYYKDDIILAIRKEDQIKYNSNSQAPDIQAWVMNDENTGLTTEEALSKGKIPPVGKEPATTLLEEALKVIETLSVDEKIPRYSSASHRWEWWMAATAIQDWCYRLDDDNQDGEVDIDTETTTNKEKKEVVIPEDYYVIWFDQEGGIVAQVTNYLQQSNIQKSYTDHQKELIWDAVKAWKKSAINYYIQDLLSLTKNEQTSYAVAFFKAYEKFISVFLEQTEHVRELRWYQYQFNSPEKYTDSVGGTDWMPFGTVVNSRIGDVDFQYYTHFSLTGKAGQVERWNFNQNSSETRIKAALAQQQHKTSVPSIDTDIEAVDEKARYVTTLSWARTASEVMTFENEKSQDYTLQNTQYLTLSGMSHLNIYDNSYKKNDSAASNLPSGWDSVTVGFRDDKLIKDMGLKHGETQVKWEILNANAGLIKSFSNSLKEQLDDMIDHWIDSIDKLLETENHKLEEYTLSLVRCMWWYDDRGVYSQPTEGHYVLNKAKLEQMFNEDLWNYFEEKAENWPSDLENDLIKIKDALTAIVNAIPDEGKTWTSLEAFQTQHLMPVISQMNSIIKIYQTINDMPDTNTTYITRYKEGTRAWATVTFEPADTFDPTKNQSRIQCSVGAFSVTLDISFGLIGTQGTGYSLVIVPAKISEAWDVLRNHIDRNLIGIEVLSLNGTDQAAWFTNFVSQSNNHAQQRVLALQDVLTNVPNDYNEIDFSKPEHSLVSEKLTAMLNAVTSPDLANATNRLTATFCEAYRILLQYCQDSYEHCDLYKGIPNEVNPNNIRQYKAVLRDANGNTLNVQEYGVEWTWKQKRTYKRRYWLNNDGSFTRANPPSLQDYSVQPHPVEPEGEAWIYAKKQSSWDIKDTTLANCYWENEADYDAENPPNCFIKDIDYIHLSSNSLGIAELTLNYPFSATYLGDNQSLDIDNINKIDKHYNEGKKTPSYYYYDIAPKEESEDVPADEAHPGYLRCTWSNKYEDEKYIELYDDPHEPNNHILQVSCKVPVQFNENDNAQTVTLSATYPIAIYSTAMAEEKIEQIDGVFSIAWDETNSLVTPKLEKQNNVEYFETSYKPQDNTTKHKWEIISPDKGDFPWAIYDITVDKNTAPRLVLKTPGKSGFFSTEAIIQHVTEDNELLYQVPLLTYINTWSTDVTNAWSGAGVSIGEEEGIILASQIAAGHKNSITNTFTGIIMGDITKNYSSAAWKTGLFGYTDGQEFFRVSTDGTFVVYYNNQNYINFTTEGLKIATQHLEINTSQATIQTNPADGSYYLRFSANNDPIFYVTKSGNVFLKGEIQGTAGYLANWGINIQPDGDTNKYALLYDSELKTPDEGRGDDFPTDDPEEKEEPATYSMVSTTAQQMENKMTRAVLGATPQRILAIRSRYATSVEDTDGTPYETFLLKEDGTLTLTYRAFRKNVYINGSNTNVTVNTHNIAAFKNNCNVRIPYWEPTSSESFDPMTRMPSFASTNTMAFELASQTQYNAGVNSTMTSRDHSTRLIMFTDAAYNACGLMFHPDKNAGTVGRFLITSGTIAESTEGMSELVLTAGNYDEAFSYSGYKGTIQLGRFIGTNNTNGYNSDSYGWSYCNIYASQICLNGKKKVIIKGPLWVNDKHYTYQQLTVDGATYNFVIASTT